MAQQLHKPRTVDEAVELLSAGNETTRALAGGATLVAMMNADLVEVDALVSLAGIKELTAFARDAHGNARLGAMRRHRETAFESDLRGGQSAVALAAAQIANATVRNMGTIGGSIAFADPAADYPAALVAADASVEIAGTGGRRVVAAEGFFLGWYETALEPGEIVTAVIVPAAPGGSLGGYRKLCRVSGDFAIASVAVRLDRAGGAVNGIRVSVGGCGGGPVRVAEAEAALTGSALEDDDIATAGELIVEALDPVDDVRASAAYRRRVVPRLLHRLLREMTEGEPVT